MNEPFIVDLHLHTLFSDGDLSLYQLMKLCKKRGIEELAITDHDTVINMINYKILEEIYNIHVIPAVEITAFPDGMHILGYGISNFVKMEEIFDDIKSTNVDVCIKTIELLNKSGIDITFEKVNAMKMGHFITKRDIARYFVSHGFAKNNKEVYDKFIGRGLYGYVPNRKLSMIQVLNLIKECGGISVLAHPVSLGNKTNYDKLLDEMKAEGLSGMETITTAHSKEDIFYFTELAKKHNLVQTCGTDFHRYSMGFLPGCGIDKHFLDGFHSLL